MVLGSMVAVAGGGSAAVLLQTRGTAAQTAAAGGRNADAVIGEVRQQLKGALAGLENGSGEAARRAASLAQIWAAHIHARTPDSEIRALAQRGVRRQGRAAILDAPVNHAEMDAHFRAMGLTGAQIAQLDLHAPPDPQAKEAALDRLLAEGMQPVVDRAVSMLTRTAERLDATGGLRPIAARTDFCDDICLGQTWFHVEMEIACGLAALGYIFPPMLVFAEICALFASFWLIMLAACQLCRALFG
jgi:hypothetical protein